MRFSFLGYTFEFYRPVRHDLGFHGLDFGGLGCRQALPFAQGEINSVLMMITNRMSNAEWHAENGDPSDERGGLLTVEGLFAMVREYSLLIVTRMFRYGFCDFDARTLLPVGIDGFRWEKERENELREGARVRDAAENIVRVYDDVYSNTGKTRAVLLAPSLSMLDTVNNADLNLIDNYGAMGILSPENSQHSDGYVDDEEYEKMQQEYHKVHGIKFGKWALMITRRSVKYQPIQLPIAALQLSEKRKNAIGSLLQALDIPKELHALFESAKFLNMVEAERTMYSSCVTHWCCVMLRVMEDVYNRHREVTEQRLPDNVFWFDFVGVPALQEAMATEAQRTRETVDYLLGLLEKWPEKREYIEKRINDLIETI